MLVLDHKETLTTIGPFVIDGCTVTLSSTVDGTDDPIRTIKEILLSAYRSKATNR